MPQKCHDIITKYHDIIIVWAHVNIAHSLFTDTFVIEK